MRRLSSLLAVALCCASVLLGCGTNLPPGTAATAGSVTSAGALTPPDSASAGRTLSATAEAYIRAWEAEDAAALEQLLLPAARSAWAMAGGTSKWLRDQRGSYGDPLLGGGRVLAIEEAGGGAQAHVAIAYACAGCPGDAVLPGWPPAGSVAVANKLTLERDAGGSWLISYLDGSNYLAALRSPTWTALARATRTAYAAGSAATRAVQDGAARATGTARATGAQASRTTQRLSLNATATALWQEWFPRPTVSPQPAARR